MTEKSPPNKENTSTNSTTETPSTDRQKELEDKRMGIILVQQSSTENWITNVTRSPSEMHRSTVEWTAVLDSKPITHI